MYCFVDTHTAWAPVQWSRSMVMILMYVSIAFLHVFL